MKKNNEIQVIDGKSNRGIRILKEDRIIEFSPEISEQFARNMINLGTQLVSEGGKVTVEYFKTQANMYYAELNAYISNQTLKSEERRNVLKIIEKITDQYADLINASDDPQKRDALKQTYEFLFNKNASLYMKALASDSTTLSPQKNDLLSSLRRFFFGKN